MGRPRIKASPRWEKVLRFIKAYTKIHGVSPSYAVMAESLGFRAKSNMHRIVKRLEQEGHLEVRSGRVYGIKVVDRSVREIASL